MDDYNKIKQAVDELGFAVVNSIYSAEEINGLVQLIEAADQSGPAFRSSKDLFAIRSFLKAVPGISDPVFNENLKTCIRETFGPGCFVIKSIYFDKPQESNWFVAYHQDLMISVNQKAELAGYGPWTVRPGQVAVLPPVAILEGNFTLRIHLDKTDEHNGALKVIPGSHRKQIYRPETIDRDKEQEVIARVEQGGVMIMKPLLHHASGRSINSRRRRVIHIEFSKTILPDPLQWSEYQLVPGLS